MSSRRRQIGPDPLPIPVVLPAPVRGVDHSLPVAQQPELTCPDAMNVVSFPSLADRTTIGKRDGTSRESSTRLTSTVTGDFTIHHVQMFMATQTSGAPSGGGFPTSWSEMNGGLSAAGSWLVFYGTDINLLVGGNFTTAGTITAERFGTYDTDVGVWTAPINSFSTSQDNPSRSVVWDADGLGDKTYTIGGVGSTPTLNRVSRWNGSAWEDMLGTNTGVTAIHALCVYQGKLFIAGQFTACGTDGSANTSANNIAYWDPSQTIGRWQKLIHGSGGTEDGVTGGIVYALAVMNGILYVGGSFTACAGATIAANCMAEYNGTTLAWRSIGGYGAGPQTTGLGTVLCMTVTDIGNGEKLYIGGTFGNINTLNVESLALAAGQVGGVTASDHSMITSWDGHTFEPLISGLRGKIGSTTGLLDYGVLSIEKYNDGIRPGIYVSGRFNAASTSDGLGKPAPSIAKWDGNEWTVPVQGLAGGASMSVRHMIPGGDPSNLHLYATGSFQIKNNVAVNGLAVWDGDVWECLAGAGIPNPNFGSGRCAIRDGSALLHDAVPKLWLGVSHSTPATYSYILGCGSAPPIPGSKGSRYSLSSYDGSRFNEIPGWTDYLLNPAWILDANIGTTGNMLYVCGGFTQASGAPRNYIARWDGQTWFGLSANTGESALQTDGYVMATDGTVLVVGGAFTKVTNTGAMDVANTKILAKWTASTNTWSACTAVNNTGTSVDALYYNSTDSLFYVGGLFSLLGGIVLTVNVGTFNPVGPAYLPLDLGLNGRVLNIVKYGADIYACGVFTADGRGTAMNYIAKWDSGTTRWVVLGGGLSGGDTAHAMFVHDDGGGLGSCLYVVGNFTTATNGAAAVTCNAIARWNGTSWSAVDSIGSVMGGFGGRESPPRGTAIAEYDGRLVVMGGFTDASGETATYIARGEVD